MLERIIALSIRFSRPFLAYPSVTFIDTMIARALLNMLTNIAVIAIVITGIFIVYQIPPVVNMAAIFESLVMISLLGIGVGSMNCYLMTAFPVWERTWQIVTRPLFLISGTLFLYDFQRFNGRRTRVFVVVHLVLNGGTLCFTQLKSLGLWLLILVHN